MLKSTIAVLIPCYNESQTIAKVVADYKQALPEAEIYVYDNNSQDHTDALAQSAGAIVRYEYRQGKGNVIRSMFRGIEADCYLMIDGDDTYPAESAREMCNLVLQGKADMVIGDRLSSTYFAENKRPFHNCFLSSKNPHFHQDNSPSSSWGNPHFQRGHQDADFIAASCRMSACSIR